MSSFWSLWIIVLFLICTAGLVWLLLSNRHTDLKEGEVKGHVFDGIEEYDNPLPSWFFSLFLGSIIFSLIYLALYPGFGNFKGLLGWTQISSWEESVEQAETDFKTLVAPMMEQSAENLVNNAQALKMGGRIFKSNCVVCHGSDAKGSYAFPNLTDDDWLYGGSEDAIKQTLNHGRKGLMPGWKAALGQDLDAMVDYVADLSSMSQSVREASPVHQKYTMFCSACHGADAKGNHLFGAPNLTDDIWLYGGSKGEIKLTLEAGRNGNMPKFSHLLSPERIHLVSAYVMSLSRRGEAKAE